MSADQGLREAWERIPTPGEVGQELERFAGRRMERIIAIVVGVGALALGAQALVSALLKVQVADASYLAMMAIVFVPWVAMLVCCALGRAVRITAGVPLVNERIVERIFSPASMPRNCQVNWPRMASSMKLYPAPMI